jgi:hypothetical protein
MYSLPPSPKASSTTPTSSPLIFLTTRKIIKAPGTLTNKAMAPTYFTIEISDPENP